MLKSTKLTILTVLAVIVSACDVSLQIQMPEGPQGAKGFSAYELWLQEISNGNIVWPGNTEVVDFFLYLKGKPGNDGLSAYELWLEQVNTGMLDDPHNPGAYWPTDDISMVDFWYYLSGSNGDNGLSAWELWKIAVAGGLVNPHDDDGGNWPVDETTIEDFWRYLRGRDGDDGAVVYEDTPGTVGKIIEIEIGKYNVIPQYVDQTNNEYVNPTSGEVTFFVYNYSGASVGAGVEVSKLPGLDSNKTFTTLEKVINEVSTSYITLTRDDLCDDKPLAERRGTCLVNGEETAGNTYVPNRVDVRIRIAYTSADANSTTSANIPYLSNSSTHTAQQIFKVITERHSHTTGSDWETIPQWIRYSDNTTTRKISYFRCKENDPYTYYTTNDANAAPTNNSTGGSGSAVNRFATGVSVTTSTIGGSACYFTRRMKTCDYINLSSSTVVWDGQDMYGTVVVTDMIYGMTNLQANAVIQFAPVQFMPYVTSYKTEGLNTTNIEGKTYYFFNKIEGTFGINDAFFGNTEIDKNIIYKRNFSEESALISPTTGETFYRYKAQKVDWEEVKAQKLFYVRITDSSGAHANSNSDSPASIDTKIFGFTTPYSSPADAEKKSTFELVCNTPYFRSIGKCGDFYHEVDGTSKVTTYVKARTTTDSNNGYSYALIPRDESISPLVGVVSPLSFSTSD